MTVTLADLSMPAVRDSRLDSLPVAIIGAGPVGLAAAAHTLPVTDVCSTGSASACC
jgi:threonine dehydrogenase-like Zn-dependent dehydrogenase